MMFAKSLRSAVMSGEITSSVRIWRTPRVKVGGRYAFVSGGVIEVTWIREIDAGDITPGLARASGFKSVEDLLKTARHGRGERVFVVDFDYHPAA